MDVLLTTRRPARSRFHGTMLRSEQTVRLARVGLTAAGLVVGRTLAIPTPIGRVSFDVIQQAIQRAVEDRERERARRAARRRRLGSLAVLGGSFVGAAVAMRHAAHLEESQ